MGIGRVDKSRKMKDHMFWFEAALNRPALLAISGRDLEGIIPSLFPPKYFHLSESNRMLVPLHLNKPALRTLGIAESFVRTCPSSRLAGVVMRADLRVDGVAFARATVGGDDATEGVLKIYEQLGRADINAVILSGAVISWFNIIDIQEVFDIIQKPVICLTYEESPGLERYIREYFPESRRKAS